jgi:ribbon-helix-helix CopG family protein
MQYKPTQVYLDPEDHARLKAEAQRRGLSLAALIRELTSSVVGERAPPYGAKTWDSITAISDGNEATDIAREGQSYVDEAAEALFAKKMRLARGEGSKRRPRRKK